MRRELFTEDHDAFRQLARDFVEKEVVPHYPEWEKAGRMPRETFELMGSLGMLGMAIPEEYGGSGTPDYRYNVVLQEEAARALVTLSTVRHPTRRDPSVFPALCERRATATLVTRSRRRHTADGHRDDRARHRLRPGGHAHHRGPRR